MKIILLTGLLALAACGLTDTVHTVIASTAVGTNIASIATIHRSPVDAAYSWWTGRDCSIVRLDEGKTYCRAVEPPPEPPVFCTHSLASADCWEDPGSLPGHPRQVADGPAGLTATQEADRLRTWP